MYKFTKFSKSASALAVTLLGFASASAASFTWVLTNVLDGTGTVTADNVNNTAFSGVVNMIYSTIIYLVQFFTQGTVLAVLIALGVISVIAGAVWTKIRARAIKGGGKRRR